MRYDKEVRVMEVSADLVRAAFTDMLKARPNEPFGDALHRVIDERVSYNRWYRKAWRWVARFPLEAK